MTKRMLADVLWKAANKYLLDSGFSCHAVADAMCEPRENTDERPSHLFLRSLGCPNHASHCAAWDWLYEEGMEDAHSLRVATRYMWLLLAMHVAEDEGVTL